MMPIQIKCNCGKTLRVKDELAGKKVRCPGCSEIRVAPPPIPDDNGGAEFAVSAAPPPTPKFHVEKDDEKTAISEKPVSRPAMTPLDPLDNYDDEEEDDERDLRRRRRRRRSPDVLHTSGGGIGSGVWAGVGLMLAGVFLFVAPLAVGHFVPYSLIVFIAGAVTVVRAALSK